MAKLCNEQYHCDLSGKGSTTHRGSSPIATIDWRETVETVACVKNWWNRKCHCEGYITIPCGDTKGALIYNIPNSRADGPYPTQPGQRIFSERNWQTKVPKSELSPFDNSTAIEKEKRNKKIKRNIGIGLGIAGLVAGLFAISKNRKKKQELYPKYTRTLTTPSNTFTEEDVSILDRKLEASKRAGPGEINKTLIYVGIIGIVSLTAVIIYKAIKNNEKVVSNRSIIVNV